VADQETPSPDVADVVHQPTLPALELPEYHGRAPVGMKTAVSGAGNRVTRPHGIGDRVVLVVEAKVKKAGHEETDDGLVYAETLKVVDLFELDRDPGARLISTVRSAYRTAEDSSKGRAAIPDLGDVGYTDAAGVVLTPKEVAALRGDPVRVLVTEGLTPAVVVFDDGHRDLWPDDYERDEPRPFVGQTYHPGTEDEISVVELLHHVTGERLEIAPEDLRPETVSIEVDASEFVEAVEDFAAAYDDAEPFEVSPFEVDETPEAPALPGEEALADELPNAAAFEFVDCPIDELREKLADVADVILLRRFLNAEKQGRGRALKYRQGALDAIHARLAAIGAE
jgi:hypothetical protein